MKRFFRVDLSADYDKMRDMSTNAQKDLTPVVPRKFRPVFFMLVSCFEVSVGNI